MRNGTLFHNMPKQLVKGERNWANENPSKPKTHFDKVIYVPSRGENQKHLFDLLKETDIPQGKLLIYMEKMSLLMWKLTNWPKVKQHGTGLGNETPGLKGNCQ